MVARRSAKSASHQAYTLLALFVVALLAIALAVAAENMGGESEQMFAAAAASRTPCPVQYKSLRDECYRRTRTCGLNMNVAVKNGKTTVTPVKSGATCSSTNKDVSTRFDDARATSDTSTSWACSIPGFESACGSASGQNHPAARATAQPTLSSWSAPSINSARGTTPTAQFIMTGVHF